jgi:hypothetical protein
MGGDEATILGTLVSTQRMQRMARGSNTTERLAPAQRLQKESDVMATMELSRVPGAKPLTGHERAEVRAGLAGGEPLQAEARRFLEQSLGIELSAIRVHADSTGDHLTRVLCTDAFAAGPHLFFRDGAYQPQTRAGLGLLAHEVTHTLQQAQPAAFHTRSAAEMEREADAVARDVLAGQRRYDLVVAAGLTDSSADAPLAIQRHESFEHRALGDVPGTTIRLIAEGGKPAEAALDLETKLMWLWHQNPEAVSEDDVKKVSKDIRLIRLPASGLLVTYGELNALPDYIASAQAIDTCPKNVLLPILQSIRQESYYRLNQINGKETNDRFALSPFGPHDSIIGSLNKVFNSWALDALTVDLGLNGEDHYTGLLARNACHFAPYTWYRWQAAYLTARDLAVKSFQASGDEKKRLRTLAWMYHGYADHFLQDSFAAGHLVNKTLVSQWFIKWSKDSNLPIEDWEMIKNVTLENFPTISSSPLYNSDYKGLGTDPQTIEEQSTRDARLKLTGITAYTPKGEGQVDQAKAYQQYYSFLSSVIAQMASNALHDKFNERSLYVSSVAHPEKYRVYGDDTLFTKNGSIGAQITADVAHLSQQSIKDLLSNGTTSITTEQLRNNFPTMVANDENTPLVSLEKWAYGQEKWTINEIFESADFLKKRVASQAFPRMLNFAQDQEFANQWYTGLPNAGYNYADVAMAGTRLFAGSQSMLYELRPNTGQIIAQKQVTNAQDTTHIATDGEYVYTGVYGYVRATNLNNWGAQAWAAPLPGMTSWPVNLLLVNKRLFAGSNGFLIEINPRTGARVNTLTLSNAYGPEVRLATDGAKVYAGSHGYLYAIDLKDTSKVAWTAPMKDASYSDVQPLCANGMLFAGSNGSVLQFNTSDGTRLRDITLSAAVDEPVRLAMTDKNILVAGCHGYAYGINLSQWTKVAWTTPVAGKLYKMVDVVHHAGRIYACSNGYIQRLDAATGKVLNSMQLSNILGSGDYTPSMTVHTRHGLMIGMHGYAYNTLL